MAATGAQASGGSGRRAAPGAPAHRALRSQTGPSRFTSAGDGRGPRARCSRRCGPTPTPCWMARESVERGAAAPILPMRHRQRRPPWRPCCHSTSPWSAVCPSIRCTPPHLSTPISWRPPPAQPPRPALLRRRAGPARWGSTWRHAWWRSACQEFFGVPGDYTLAVREPRTAAPSGCRSRASAASPVSLQLLDELEKQPGLKGVYCCNELGAGKPRSMRGGRPPPSLPPFLLA